MTTGPSYERIFDRLKSEVPDWRLLLLIPIESLAALIAQAGLSHQKAPRMVTIATRLEADFGKVTLEPLRRMGDAEAERYLLSLPGVGVKTAKCVLMYALGRAVLPVDTHVRRVGSRLGLLPTGVPVAQIDAALETIVPSDCRYDFHVNAVAHGREVCRALRPRCEICPLQDICPSASLVVVIHTNEQAPNLR